MKVLFQAYNTCCQTESGGVQVRVRRIKELLEERAIIVDFFCSFSTKLKDYDVLHIFSLTSESLSLAICAKKLGLRVVISPIVNVTRQRAKSIRRSLLFYRIIRHYTSDLLEHQLYQLLEVSDAILVESPSEALFIEKYYKMPSEKIRVVPNGVDNPKPANQSIFKLLNKECRYCLQVGRIDKNKNLLNTIKAVKGANYDLVVIGGPYAVSNDDYYDRCRKEAAGCDNIHFLGWLDSKSDLLASAYQNAQALILPSKTETFGLVAVEAAIYGTHICIANNLPILDYGVFNQDLTFDASDISEIRKVLDKAMSLPKNDDVKEAVTQQFSWYKIIDEILQAYHI